MIEGKLSENLDVLTKYTLLLNNTEPIRKSGKVVEVLGNVIFSEGPPDSRIGEIMQVERKDSKSFLECEVVGFEGHKYTLMPLGPIEGIFPEAYVYSTGKKLHIPVGRELLGRVLNGAGKPIDDKGFIITNEYRNPENETPNPLDRPIIKEILSTGVRAIDGMLTVGRGQRLGLFSGSGVGKSTLLGMIAKYTDADVNVVALIGERGKEVNEFLEQDLGKEGMKKTVVFIATSDAPKMQQVNCALLATTAAEYFRDQGLHVNLLMDSLTRFAQANREIGISFGEPVITRGFGPSVFTKLSNLVERAGTAHSGGSITGFYTILTEADEMNDPIADAVRGYLDGHIVLSRKIAERNFYPAIDVPVSISRSMQKIVPEEQSIKAGLVREMISTYRDAEELIRLNAYAHGSDPRVDAAIAKKDIIDSYLKQDMYYKSGYKEAVSMLDAIFHETGEEDFY